MTRVRGPLAGTLAGAIGLCAFLFLFYTRYWQWRDCFNELGRCYDPDGSHVVYTTAGQVWGFLAIPFLVMLLASAWMLIRRLRP